MSSQYRRENDAAFLPGMPETDLVVMDDYEQHRLALLQRIGEAADPNISRTALQTDLQERARAIAQPFGEAFLALYDYRQGDVSQVRRLTARLWRTDDISRYAVLNRVTRGHYEVFLSPRPDAHRWMVQERTDMRCPEPLLWSSLIGRRYRDRILSDIKKLMHSLPQK